MFPGTKGDAPYEVTSTPKPPNLYGETKHEGEKAVLGEYEKAGKAGSGVVLRVPVLYGEAESPAESAVNVLMTSVEKAQEKGAGVKMDHWAIRYPTNTEDVGRVCHGRVFPDWFGDQIFVLTVFRRRSQIPRDRKQGLPPKDPPLLLRRQIH